MFDPRNITIPDYYFIVDSDGNAHSDTADLDGAINLAIALSEAIVKDDGEDLAWYVVDAYQVLFEVTAPNGCAIPWIDEYGYHYRTRPENYYPAILSQ